MDRGRCTERSARSGALITTMTVLLATLCLLLVLGACGGDKSGGSGSATTAAPTQSSGQASSDAEGEGVLLAKEILGTFDELVGKAAGLAENKPDSDTLKPQLEGLYEEYREKMAALNKKYLDLRESSSSEFGACNSYLGEFRGRHTFEKDNTLTEAIKYYNLELGDQEMVSLLSEGPVELLDVAVKQ